MIKIRKLPANRWKDYRDLRLEALKSDSLAFGKSYSEEKNLKEKEWKKKVSSVLFALSNNKPIGMIGFYFESNIKTRHIANIFGVYVKKDFRNQGIGKILIESAIKLIKKNKKIIKIGLHVNPKQKTAVNVYKNQGFKVIGVLKKDLFVDGKFYDEIIMEKML